MTAGSCFWPVDNWLADHAAALIYLLKTVSLEGNSLMGAHSMTKNGNFAQVRGTKELLHFTVGHVIEIWLTTAQVKERRKALS